MPEFPANMVLAAVQAAPVYLDRERTVAKACDLIREAGAHGAQVIGFPEGFIPAHPYWFHFYPARSPVCQKFYLELFRNAVEIPSPATDALCAAAAQAHAYVVMGVCERVPETTGTLYNTQIFIGSDGRLLGRHRKIVPTLTERLVHGRGDGSTLGLVPTSFGPLGALMCGEHTNSLARFFLLAGGEKLHVGAWPAWFAEHEQYFKEGLDVRTRNHAFEGKIYVINACGVFTRRMIEELCPSEQDRRHLSVVSEGGHSSIIGPKGEFLAGPLEDGEDILYAEAEYERMIQAKGVHDMIGHYNRFDIFRLAVNRASLEPLDRSGDVTAWLQEPAAPVNGEPPADGPA